MRQNPRDEKAAERTRPKQLAVPMDRNLNPGESSRQVIGRVLPFSRPRPKPKPQPEGAPAELRVAELKARVKKGQYRVDSARLAEKMIREALIENLMLAGRKRPNRAVT